MIDKENTDLILKLHKLAVEEYRFQVNLNWDRNKFYVLLSSGLITAACGLLRIPSFTFVRILTFPLFILGLLCSWIGLTTLLKGVEYRRRIIYQKSLIEDKLSEFIEPELLPIQTTKGMRSVPSEDLEKFLARPPRIGTISYFIAVFFVFLMLINGIVLISLIFGYLPVV